MSRPMTKAAVARIQSTTAKANDGKVPKGSFAAKAASVAAKNETANKHQPNWPSKVPNVPSGKNRDNNPPAPKPR